MNNISSHSMAKCEQFAHVLLNDCRKVRRLKSDNMSQADFILAVLDDWVSSVEGPAVACTWPSLIECMRKADMDGKSIQEIRAVVMPLAGKAIQGKTQQHNKPWLI